MAHDRRPSRPADRRRPDARDRSQRQRGSWSLLLVVGAVALVVVLGMLASQQRTQGPATSDAPTGVPVSVGGSSEDSGEPALDMARRTPDDPLALGSVDAPVVLVEYADFRCPFCAVYAKEIQPVLIEEYVDKGLLRIEWRDLPIFGQQSLEAAVAGRAAARQGRFWEFNRAAFAGAGERGHQELPRDRLIEIAKEAGVPDIDAFAEDLDDPELVGEVSADVREAKSLGAQSTPTFLVGDTPILGAQPVDVFRQTIEQELAQAGQ